MNVPEKSSSFKKTLIKLEKGTTVTATRIGGNFILSRHQTPVVFIAGGIGITPFRSMLEDLLLRGEKRPITIFYGVRDSSLLVFKDVLQRARDELKATIVPVIDQPSISWPGETGKITPEIISRYVDVHAPAHYYISGSNAMVEATKQSLRRSIKHSTIHTDYFTGY